MCLFCLFQTPRLTVSHFQGLLSKLVLSGTGILVGGTLVSLKTSNEDFYKHLFMPMVKLVPAEESHKLAVLGFKLKLFGEGKPVEPENLVRKCDAIFSNKIVLTLSLFQRLKLIGIDLKNPVGLAAGFDKNAEAVEGLDRVGFGFIEVGSVTPKPQDGNEKPRCFRLLEDNAIVNRYGFNSDGLDVVQQRLKILRMNDFKGVLGVNLGKNKTSEAPIEDYRRGISELGPYCDYLVINISSPNTPGLRSMQNKRELEDLLKACNEERNKLLKPVPLLLKIAPDLNESEMKDIAKVVQCKGTKVDALIVSNTTISRPDSLISSDAKEVGGLSGAPLAPLSTKIIGQMYKLTKGQVPIIGAGGISSGQDAYEKILAGASAVQIYTAMTYQGPPIVNRIKSELSELLEKDNYKNVSEAVGKAGAKK